MQRIVSTLSRSNVSVSLGRAVVDRLHVDGDELESTLRDVVNHGAEGGFGSFVYYYDTCAFFEAHRTDIRKLVEATAEDHGVDPIELVRGFRCLRDMEPTASDVARVLYGTEVRDGIDNIDTQVANALAWFALEETARVLVDE